MNKTILSLFDYSGNWSRPYKDAGYNVIQVDIKHGQDILTWNYKQFSSVHGILAAPPCTDFSVSGNRYWKQKDADGRTAHSLALVDRTIEIIEFYETSLVFWALENPVGRLRKLRSCLGSPWYFNPWEFGANTDECYSKKTGLYGQFNRPIKNPCSSYLTGNNTFITKLGGTSERTKELRSLTPKGFAQAFFEANK